MQGGYGVTLSTQRPELIPKQPGAEPLPGYRLLLPLGRGGFGEVWKCEAPGGLHKAIKFVAADGERFRQELAAFEQIKAIRHPFILGLDRVELSGGELIMVMELADCQLQDRFRTCKIEGLPGIPREELIGYLEEVAESLDLISSRYGLQHLDVKPENLFLVGGHAKVGDYGLVRRTQRKVKDEDNRGFTPRYTAPEVLLGRVDSRSDQYSLALVYTELLTGCFPYSGQSAQQLMLQHLHSAPDLSKLPDSDLASLGRALAKEPGHRFPSCLAFIRSLLPELEPPASKLILRDLPSIIEETPSSIDDQTILISSAKPVECRERDAKSPDDSVEQTCNAETIAVNRGSHVQLRGNRSQASRKSETPADPFAGLMTVMAVNAFKDSSHRALPPTILSAEECVDCVIRERRGPGGELPVYIAGGNGPLQIGNRLRALEPGLTTGGSVAARFVAGIQAPAPQAGEK
jgi:serine/threonine protein kinase